MANRRVTLLAAAALLLAGCADGGSHPMAPEEPLLHRGQAAGPIGVAGTFDANIEPQTFSLTPLGRLCKLVVEGTLVFSGGIEGAADATTTAIVFAPCEDVAGAPPGAFPDVFWSRLHFAGTVDGQPVESRGIYKGRAEAGGAIDARIIFFGGLAGALDVEATVAVGGSYEGRVVVR